MLRMPHTRTQTSTWTTAGVAALQVVDRLRRVRETSARHGPKAEEKGAGEGTDGSARAPPAQSSRRRREGSGVIGVEERHVWEADTADADRRDA